MKTFKITVRPVTQDLSLVLLKQSSKVFTTEKEALQHAKHLIKKGWQNVSYNTDTYQNGVVVRNEFAVYDGEKLKITSFTNYTESKKEKLVYDKSDNLKMFFNEADLKRANTK